MRAVLWRTWTLRATAIPLALVGFIGAGSGAGFDMAIPATGDAAAIRLPSGQLTLLGKKPGAFAAEQWLRADADARAAADARGGAACDDLGCVGRLVDGREVSLVLSRGAFLEDCARAAIIVTPLYAPGGCAAPLVIDRARLAETGAISLRLGKDNAVEWTSARGIDEDRPWSPRPAQASRQNARVEDEESEEAELAETLN